NGQAEEGPGQRVEFRAGENFVVVAVGFGIGRAAVDTAEVAAVRDGDAQVGDLAAEFVMKDHTLSHSLDAAASYLGAPQLLKQNRPIQCLESDAHRKTTHLD